MQLVAEGLGFPEGPVWMPDGSLVFVEIARGRLSRVSSTGVTSVVAELGGGPNGAALMPDGGILVCNNGGGDFVSIGGAPYAQGRIEVVDPESGSVECLYDADGEHPLSAPNDLVLDGAGGFWFTDFGKRHERFQLNGSVYWASLDGREIRPVITGLHSPNGIGLSPDGRTLYVTETLTARLWSWPIESPGELSRRRGTRHGGVFVAGTANYRRFDSLAVTESGRVLVGTLDDGGITEIDPMTGRSWFHPVDDRFVTNLCFGGEDFSTLYLTLAQSGRIVAAPWCERGLRPAC